MVGWIHGGGQMRLLGGGEELQSVTGCQQLKDNGI